MSLKNTSLKNIPLKNMDINSIDFNQLNKYFSNYAGSIDFDKEENLGFLDSQVNTCQKNISIVENDICVNCGGNVFIEDNIQGIVVCTNGKCGQVLRTIIDVSPEWKQFDDDDKAGGRCGAPINALLPQSSLGTSIRGYRGCRLKILQSWNSMPYKERSLNNEFKKIHDVCQREEIAKCVEDDTKIMYKMICECKHITGRNKGQFVITRGINRKSILASCLFFACIRKGITRTSKEIAKMWGIKDMDMNKGCKNLLRLMKLRNSGMNMGISKPEHFIKRYCMELKISEEHMNDALKIANNIEKLNIVSGHTPYSSASACILMMAEFNNLKSITKKRIASQFGISDVTIGKTYKELEPYKNVLNDDTMSDDVSKKIKNEINNRETDPIILERMKKFGIAIEDVKQVDNIPEIEEIDNELELDFDCQDIICGLHEKFNEINKILKAKPLKDIKKELDVLKNSHELIKNIKEDLNFYKENFLNKHN